MTTATRFVIGPDVTAALARDKAAIQGTHSLLAPTLFRSQLLSLLYGAVRKGELTAAEAEASLAYVRGLRIRLLGDRVLQRSAWRIAEQPGWDTTLDAEYLALTRLQADAFVTLDTKLASSASSVVAVAPYESLI